MAFDPKKKPVPITIIVPYQPKLISRSEWLEASHKLSDAKTPERYRHWAMTIGDESRFNTEWSHAKEHEKRLYMDTIVGLWKTVAPHSKTYEEFELAVAISAIHRVNYKNTKVLMSKIKRSDHINLSVLATGLLEAHTILLKELRRAERFMADFLSEADDVFGPALDDLTQQLEQLAQQ